MYYTPDATDKEIALSRNKNIDISVRLISADGDIDLEMSGKLLSDSYSIDSESDIRRGYDFEIALKSWTGNAFDIDAGLSSESDWFNVFIYPSITIYFRKGAEVVSKTYELGKFLFDSQSYSWDATSRTISLGCVDLMSRFTGDRGGALSGMGTLIETNTNTSPVLSNPKVKASLVESYGNPDYVREGEQKNTILGAMSSTLTQLGGLASTDYELTDPADVENAEIYIPYDLEYAVSSYVYDIIADLRDLNTGWETFFDTDGKFIFQPIEAVRDVVPPVLTAEETKKLLVSENEQRDMTKIKNCIELWGKTWEGQYTADTLEDVQNPTNRTTFSVENPGVLGVYTLFYSNYCNTEGTDAGVFTPGSVIQIEIPEGGGNLPAQQLTFWYKEIGSDTYTPYAGTAQDPKYFNVVKDGSSDLPLGFLEPGKVYLFMYSDEAEEVAGAMADGFVYLGESQIAAIAKLYSTKAAADAAKADDELKFGIQMTGNIDPTAANGYISYNKDAGVWIAPNSRTTPKPYFGWKGDSIAFTTQYLIDTSVDSDGGYIDILFGKNDSAGELYAVSIPTSKGRAWVTEGLYITTWPMNSTLPPSSESFTTDEIYDTSAISTRGESIRISHTLNSEGEHTISIYKQGVLTARHNVHTIYETTGFEKLFGFASLTTESKVSSPVVSAPITVTATYDSEPTRNISYIVDPSSQYTIDKIGEVRQVLSGGEYDAVYTENLASQRAKYELWLASGRQETVSMQMIDVPWLDVNHVIEDVDGTSRTIVSKKGSLVDGTMSLETIRYTPIYYWQYTDDDSWESRRKIVQAGLGEAYFPVGTEFKITDQVYGNTLTWVVVAHDHYDLADDSGGHNMVLMLKNIFSKLDSTWIAWYFDQAEAFAYGKNDIASDTLGFTWGFNQGSITAGDYRFTPSEPIQAFNYYAFTTPGSSTVLTNNSVIVKQGQNTVLDSGLTIASGADGTYLGTINARAVTEAIPTYVALNCGQRIMYGSNNYAQSAVRQWLNSSTAAGTGNTGWWSKSTIFDTLPSGYGQAGFLVNLPSDFKAVLTNVKIPCRTNNVWEIGGYTPESQYVLSDKVFLPSLPELLGEYADNLDNGSKQFQYFKDGGSTILRDLGGTARAYWTRSPSITDANSIRGIAVTGVRSEGYAHGGRGVAPICVIG